MTTNGKGHSTSGGENSAQAYSPAVVSQTFLDFIESKELFCKRLEMAADLLPDGIEAQDCLLLAQSVVPLIKRAHEFEEQVIFPALLAATEAPTGLPQTIDRLRFEHLGDEEFASDLCISLRQFVIDRNSANIDALSWMLRGFFEGLRRHIAYERDHILPLVQKQQASH